MLFYAGSPVSKLSLRFSSRKTYAGSNPEKTPRGFSLPEFVRTHSEIAPVPALVKERTYPTRPGCAGCGERGHEMVGIGLGINCG
jgi:hypothetical protein